MIARAAMLDGNGGKRTGVFFPSTSARDWIKFSLVILFSLATEAGSTQDPKAHRLLSSRGLIVIQVPDFSREWNSLLDRLDWVVTCEEAIHREAPPEPASAAAAPAFTAIASAFAAVIPASAAAAESMINADILRPKTGVFWNEKKFLRTSVKK